MTIATNSVYVIRKSSSSRKIACPKCGEPRLPAEQTAGMFDITQRRIFRVIEAGAAHFIEEPAGTMLVCLSSLAAVLNHRKKI